VGSDLKRTSSGELGVVSIHAPRVGSDNPYFYNDAGPLNVSIHAPRVGSDMKAEYMIVILGVSIHAPRVGSDKSDDQFLLLLDCFNPRPPCGERPISWDLIDWTSGFQSTPPVWGATL